MNNSLPVIITNKSGKKLFGICHLPSVEIKKNVGIIFLSPGIKSRVAPHRLYVKCAKAITNRGYIVLRFDPEGLGDSEGEIIEQFAADVYGRIQVGHFVDDTEVAIDWFKRKYDIDKVILAGLCGGAITGLLAGADNPDVVGLLAIGIPVTLDGANIDRKKSITENQMINIKSKYIGKLFSIDAWKRLLLFKSDYKLIISSLFFRKKNGNGNNKKSSHINKLKSTNFNHKFIGAFNNFTKDKKILFAFGAEDGLYWDFKDKFYDEYAIHRKNKKRIDNTEIFIVNEANHILSFKTWQQEFIDKSLHWLNVNFK